MAHKIPENLTISGTCKPLWAYSSTPMYVCGYVCINIFTCTYIIMLTYRH